MSPQSSPNMKLLLVLFALVGASLATDCLKCICNKESGCKPVGCHMDVGSLSCGYYQIKSPYYQDCGQPGKKAGEDTDTAWKRCADDYNCSSGCVQAYVNRYKSKCPNKGSCEQMSRLHNGGPNGCNNSNTVGYWNSIKSCCGCS
ncbi:ilys-5 [Pristionchus pacificus]|uniref:lysozyme n=1 Tax=Pristionchus pacificus TaxID=54126 RepID=A0A2A6CI82_PRIPA|nr:ilys-5 [Pristionchus pacificus]|eukprot:PDM77849.1 ilys-5 [Pristionchus pacificus]